MPARTYPWERFAEVIELLARELGVRVVVTGATSEKPLVDAILDRLTTEARLRTEGVAGALSFDGLCALIAAADLTITNNTGPMHVSAAVGTPVVALFALTNPPEQWGPWKVPHRMLWREVPCRICYSRICPTNHECLTGVSPRDVVDAAAGLLDACALPPAREVLPA
jgi:ADP-heptose:LPS heptosyltransferase